MIRSIVKADSWQLCRVRTSQATLYFPVSHASRLNLHGPAVSRLMSSHTSSDAYQLLSTAEKQGPSEDALYDQQVQEVKQWWASPRYDGIRRPYSADAVVSKRGSLPQTYPSSLMARKLFKLLKERAAQGEPVHTSIQHKPSGFDDW